MEGEAGVGPGQSYCFKCCHRSPTYKGVSLKNTVQGVAGVGAAQCYFFKNTVQEEAAIGPAQGYFFLYEAKDRQLSNVFHLRILCKA